MSHDLDLVHAKIARAVRDGLPVPDGGFEHRLLAALQTTPAAPRRQAHARLLTATSVALSLLVVGGLLWSSPGFRSRVESAAARAGGSAVRTVPASTSPPAGAGRFAYVAVTPPRVVTGPIRWAGWDGAALPPSPALSAAEGGVTVSPGGRYVTVPCYCPDASSTIYDSSGAVVATGVEFDVWADDGHLCGLGVTSDGRPRTILVQDVVQGRVSVKSERTIAGLPAQTNGRLAGCSLANDRAVLVAGALPTAKHPGSHVFALYGIQPSTGRIVYTRTVTVGAIDPVVSPDQRYAAVSVAAGAGAVTSTDVLELDTGRVVAHFAGSGVGFSGDDHLLALNAGVRVPTPGAFVFDGPASLVEWRTGRTVWRSDATTTIAGLDGVRSQPGGRTVALTVAHPDGTVDVVLVQGDGTSAVVAPQAEVLTPDSEAGAG